MIMKSRLLILVMESNKQETITYHQRYHERKEEKVPRNSQMELKNNEWSSKEKRKQKDMSQTTKETCLKKTNKKRNNT